MKMPFIEGNYGITRFKAVISRGKTPNTGPGWADPRVDRRMPEKSRDRLDLKYRICILVSDWEKDVWFIRISGTGQVFNKKNQLITSGWIPEVISGT